MSRFVYFFFFSILVSTASGQVKYETLQKDSGKVFKQAKLINGSISEQIKNGLQTILNKYKRDANDEAIWEKIRAEADAFLYSYYKNGKLIGVKPEQAYFLQMGLQTMTGQDIAAGKKILLAGIAERKPSEFTIIKIESLSSLK